MLLVCSAQVFILEVGLGCGTLCFVFGLEVNEFLVGTFMCEIECLVSLVTQEG